LPAASSGADLRERVISALKWNASGEIVFQGIRFVFAIALARLLSPHEIGLMAMLAVVVQFVAGNTDLGFEEALIQHRRVTEMHRSSVFWALLVLGMVLAAIQLAVAPWLARFYGVAELAPLAAALAALYVLRVLGTVPSAMLARQLDFRTILAWRCVAAIAAGTCAVTLAYSGFGALSLVVQLLLATGLESVLLLAASGWRPHRELRLAALRELLGFSAYRPAARVLNYWGQRIDQLLVGKLLGSSALGVYAHAFRLARLPVIGVSRGLADVMFPSLAQIQEERARVRAAYLRATGAAALWSLPVALGLTISAEPLVVGIFGPQWREAAPVLRLLGLGGFFQSLGVIAASLFLAQGRADLVLRLTIVQRLTSLVAVVAGLRWGIIGVAIAQLVSSACNALTVLYFAGRLIDVGVRQTLRPLYRVLLAGLTMAVIVLVVGGWVKHHLPALAVLTVHVAVGVLAYALALWFLGVSLPRELFEVLARPKRTGQQSRVG
jgi:PST family polysaccharide transporter